MGQSESQRGAPVFLLPIRPVPTCRPFALTAFGVRRSSYRVQCVSSAGTGAELQLAVAWTAQGREGLSLLGVTTFQPPLEANQSVFAYPPPGSPRTPSA